MRAMLRHFLRQPWGEALEGRPLLAPYITPPRTVVVGIGSAPGPIATGT